MGTKRRVCIWWMRGDGEYVAVPAGWNVKKFGEFLFRDRGQLLKFARASKLILKERQERRRWA